MTDAMDKIAAHFQAQKRKQIFVPEWELNIYIDPPNALVKEALREKAVAAPVGVDQSALTIIDLARTEDGKPMFDIGDKPRMKRTANPDMLAGLAASLLNAYFVDIAAAEEVAEAGKE